LQEKILEESEDREKEERVRAANHIFRERGGGGIGLKWEEEERKGFSI